MAGRVPRSYDPDLLDREMRIRAHTIRVSRMLQTLDRGPALALCWACGRAEWPQRIRPHGWAVRAIMSGRIILREIYCPECYETWGWPPLDDWDVISEEKSISKWGS